MASCQPQTFEDDLVVKVGNWINQLLDGKLVIRAYENAKSPDGQYVTVHLDSYAKVSETASIYSDIDDITLCKSITATYRATISINVYRDSGDKRDQHQEPTPTVGAVGSAIDIAMMIVLGADDEEEIYKLNKDCIYVNEFSDVQNLRALEKQKTEGRASFDMFLNVAITSSKEVPIIDRIDVIDCVLGNFNNNDEPKEVC